MDTTRRSSSDTAISDPRGWRSRQAEPAAAHRTAAISSVLLLAELGTCRDWLARRAVDAPCNFLHLQRLVEAETAWAAGDFQPAMRAFDAAQREREPRQRPWHRALITERAALFHLANGLDHVGEQLLTDARRLYAAWGAEAKVARWSGCTPSFG